MKRRGWDGAVELTATLVDIPVDERLDALGIFLDAVIKTRWLTQEPWAR